MLNGSNPKMERMVEMIGKLFKFTIIETKYGFIGEQKYD